MVIMTSSHFFPMRDLKALGFKSSRVLVVVPSLPKTISALAFYYVVRNLVIYYILGSEWITRTGAGDTAVLVYQTEGTRGALTT